MDKQSRRSETSPLGKLAGDLRIALGKLKRRLREQAHLQPISTDSQKSVLLRLDRDGPATVASALARAESVRPQSMRVTVAGLARMGAVSGKPDSTDGRQTLIDLTPDLRKALNANRAAVKDDWLRYALCKCSCLSPNGPNSRQQ